MPPERRVVHALTPGDHYSPRTGSAIPTVVHGIAEAALAAGSARHVVLVERDTFAPRYDSAEVVEYSGAPLPKLPARIADAALGRLGLHRPAATGAFRPLAEAVRALPPAVVVAHNAPALPRLVDSGHRALLYAHNDVLRTVGRREATRLLDDVPAIVCVSAALGSIVAERLPAPLAERIRIVENGVDTTVFHPSAGHRDGAPLRVMFLGRTIPEKGADVLLRAAQQLDRSDLEVVVVGSAGFDRTAPLTPYEQALRRLAADSRGPVVFERFVDRMTVPGLLRTADIFVVPSRWPDPSPLTVGEAMASGLPVVGSRVGGIPEVMGATGVLVAPDDPTELSEALEHLADDAGARGRLGDDARSRATTRSWDRTWSQLSDVLADIG